MLAGAYPLHERPKEIAVLRNRRGSSAALLIAALLCSSPVAIQAGELPTASPPSVGLSSEGLEQALASYRQAVEADEIRGAVLLVARRGKVVLHEALGWRDVAGRRPMRVDTLFHMASNTKAVIAAAVLQLAEAKALKLDDPIAKHLPAFDNARCRSMTIRQLLGHTSGLRIKTLFIYPLRRRSPQYPLAPNLQLEVDRFADVGPAKKPGTSYSYSNPGYNILAALIEAKAGRELEEHLQSRIYRPLGMTSSHHRRRARWLGRMAVVYERPKPAKDRDPSSSSPPPWRVRTKPSTKMRVPFVRGSGGLVSTSGDYFRFCQMFLNGGLGPTGRVLSATSVTAASTRQALTAPAAKADAKRTVSYGLGWKLRAGGAYGHGGSDGTYAYLDPTRELVVLVLTQSSGGAAHREAFLTAAKKAIADKP
jgi:CubicO group peptidase (beta-lactamase class C family)